MNFAVRMATSLFLVVVVCAVSSLAMANLVELGVVDYSGFFPDDASPTDSVTVPGGGGGVRKRAAEILGNENRTMIEKKLNDLRRMVQEPNMYYANWNSEIEAAAGFHVFSCRLQTRSRLDQKFVYAEGFTGYYTLDSSLSEQLQTVYSGGPVGDFYRQMMAPSMTQFACSVGQQTCFGHDQNGQMISAKIFACIFAYKSDPSQPNPSLSGSVCSQCDNDSLWCDDGLCRGSCALPSSTCEECTAVCTSCRDTVELDDDCTCIYDYADGSRRCNSHALGTTTTSCCSAEAGYTYPEYPVPIGWIICIIISSILLLTMILSLVVWHCVRQHNLARRLQRESAAASTHSRNIYEEFGPDFVPVMTPPPYVDSAVKPPPYDVTLSGPPGGDPANSSSVPATAPPPFSEINTGGVYTIQTNAYDNVACTGDETQA